jgi:hypothetical protein
MLTVKLYQSTFILTTAYVKLHATSESTTPQPQIFCILATEVWFSGYILRGCIQKFPDWVDNEIYAYNNKHSLRNNTKGYGGKTHKIDSQNSDITAPSGRELYLLRFSLQADSPETFGYTLVKS